MNVMGNIGRGGLTDFGQRQYLPDSPFN